jgi:hypothetical protein
MGTSESIIPHSNLLPSNPIMARRGEQALQQGGEDGDMLQKHEGTVPQYSASVCGNLQNRTAREEATQLCNCLWC